MCGPAVPVSGVMPASLQFVLGTRRREARWLGSACVRYAGCVAARRAKHGPDLLGSRAQAQFVFLLPYRSMHPPSRRARAGREQGRRTTPVDSPIARTRSPRTLLRQHRLRCTSRSLPLRTPAPPAPDVSLFGGPLPALTQIRFEVFFWGGRFPGSRQARRRRTEGHFVVYGKVILSPERRRRKRHSFVARHRNV